MDRMDEAFSRITLAGGVPWVKTHGLRMLNPEIFTRYPFASADSTNACQNAGSVTRFGMYPEPSAWQRANGIADCIEAHNSAPVWTKRVRTEELLFCEWPEAVGSSPTEHIRSE